MRFTPRFARLRLFAAIIGVLVLLVGGWMWFRTSPFVTIEHVRVTGVSGPGAEQIRGALRISARSMSTLDVNERQLRAVVLAYPAVRGITVSTQFPHGIVIRVSERSAVAEILVGGNAIAVSGDGTLLGDAVAAYGMLPQIPLAFAPGGARLSAPGALAAAAVLAGAPRALLAQIRDATHTAAHGVVVDLRNGPTVYFGTPTDIGAKWRATIAVLASSSSSGAVYLDVTDPDRPVAGGLSDAASTPLVAGAANVAGGATTQVAGAAPATSATSTAPTAPTAPTTPTTSTTPATSATGTSGTTGTTGAATGAAATGATGATGTG